MSSIWFISLATAILAPTSALVAVALWRARSPEHRLAEIERRLLEAPYDAPPDPGRWLSLAADVADAASDPDEAEPLDEVLARTAPSLGPHVRLGLERLLTGEHHLAPESRGRALRGHLVLTRYVPSADLTLHLAICLLDGDDRVAGTAALTVGLLAETHPGAVIPTVTALRDGGPRTAPAQAWCLGRLLDAHPRILPLVTGDPSPVVRRVVMAAVARLLATTEDAATEGVVEQLSAAVEAGCRDADAGARRAAFDALRAVEPSRRRQLVEAALDDRVQEVREAAVRGLAASGAEADVTFLVRHLEQAVPGVRREIFSALEASGAPLPASVRRLAVSEVAARTWAIEVWGILAAAAEVAPLFDQLADPDREVRVAAARAVEVLAIREETRQAVEDAVPRLVRRLADEDDARVVLSLANALALCHSSDAVQAVLERLAVEEDVVRERLLEVLARMEQFR